MSESQQPLQMVFAAQKEADKWAHELRRARQGVNQDMSFERAVREFHASVILYWDQLARLSHKPHIKQMWEEEPIDPGTLGDGHLDQGATLDDVGDIRLKKETTEQQYYDEDAGTEKTQEVTRAVALRAEEALAVKRQLDLAAQELGLGPSIDDQRPRYFIGGSGDGGQAEGDGNEQQQTNQPEVPSDAND